MSYNDLLNKLEEQVNSFSSYTNVQKKSVLNDNINIDVKPSISTSNSIQTYNTTSSLSSSKFNIFNNISKDSYIKITKYTAIILGPIIIIIICLLYLKPKFIYKDEINLKNATIKWNDSTSSSKICYKKLSKITMYIYITLVIISCIFYFYNKKRNVI